MDSNLNVRDGVRGFYIKDDKVIALKTKESNPNPDFFDIPGGGIEPNETMEEAIIREYKEETGLNIKGVSYRGIINVVFKDRIHKYNVFNIDDFDGNLQDTGEQHVADLFDIDTVIKSKKRFACTIMLEPSFLKVLLDKTKTFELTVFTSKEIISKIIFEVKNL